jgi:hypothetical protein
MGEEGWNGRVALILREQENYETSGGVAQASGKEGSLCCVTQQERRRKRKLGHTAGLQLGEFLSVERALRSSDLVYDGSPPPRSSSYCTDFTSSMGQRLPKSSLICVSVSDRRPA